MIYIIISLIIIIIVLLCKLNKSKIKGHIGEIKIRLLLLKLNPLKYKIINDVLLKKRTGYTTQIDHVVISRYGIFVIETKNYKGWVYGNKNDEKWIQSFRTSQYKFYSPIKQNEAHIDALKYLLKRRINFRSIIVFSDEAVLKNKIYNVVNNKELLKTIKKYNKPVLSRKEVRHMYKTIKKSDIKSNKARRSHVKRVKKIS
ncbi:nuclease-related domain-containing protein [Clostridium aestuarii]|uniref:Nuclease-related domain-containing protein n=1 Tax=Clostridium aestuarii TaxID=338193 RepID=A0ABT4D1E3_9CLOT|nr:nuclease-related domain-containing protein [Clostridium aestuarii]MCY6485049.1 nuclease-related domain-containing protein [Clostridium aestuarii]